MNVISTCVSCKGKIETAYNMIERQVESRQDGKTLFLTVLTCPHCKKEMIVQIDNKASLALFERQLQLSRQKAHTVYIKGEATKTQEKRLANLTDKLNNLRNDLIRKYEGTSYQFEGHVKKLEYCRPTVKIIGG